MSQYRNLELSPRGQTLTDNIYKETLSRIKAYLPHEQATALADEILSITVSQLCLYQSGRPMRPTILEPINVHANK
jgi:hypothetical protein